MVMRGSRPRANDSSCTSDVAYLYALGTPLCMIIVNRCKSPSHNSVVAHVYASVYGGLVPMYSVGCPGKIQIRESCGLRRLTWTDRHVVMRDGGGWNKMELEFYEAGCLLEVAVIKEGWITVTMRIALNAKRSR